MSKNFNLPPLESRPSPDRLVKRDNFFNGIDQEMTFGFTQGTWSESWRAWQVFPSALPLADPAWVEAVKRISEEKQAGISRCG